MVDQNGDRQILRLKTFFQHQSERAETQLQEMVNSRTNGPNKLGERTPTGIAIMNESPQEQMVQAIWASGPRQNNNYE